MQIKVVAVLKMVHPAEIVALAFGPVLGGKLEVGVEEHMIILRDVPDESRTKSQHLLARVDNIRTVLLRVGELGQVVTVQADPQLFRQQLVFGGEVQVHGLTSLPSLGAISDPRIIVLSFHK